MGEFLIQHFGKYNKRQAVMKMLGLGIWNQGYKRSFFAGYWLILFYLEKFLVDWWKKHDIYYIQLFEDQNQ